jgi:lysozyme family protein
MEKIFIKIQNSFSKYVEGLLTPYLFSFEILHPGGKLGNRSFRKEEVAEGVVTFAYYSSLFWCA